MIVQIHPRKITGPWSRGFVLDNHTLSSEFAGYDEYGHPRFDTKRSELGELLYRLKFQGDRSVLKSIVSTVCNFVRSQSILPVDIVVPVPPSRGDRPICPSLAVAEHVALALNSPFCPDCIVKAKQTPQLKDVFDRSERSKLLKGAFKVPKSDLVAGKKVLLIDDLYRSGATMSAVANALSESGHAREICVLALTKTRQLR